MRSQHGLPGEESKLQTTAARNDPRLDYAEWIGIKGFPTTPITDKPRKLNKSSDPGARYWGAKANGQRQGGCPQGWSVGFGPTQNGRTRADLRNARTVCFNFQNPPWTMLTVAVCDLFFVLHFAVLGPGHPSLLVRIPTAMYSVQQHPQGSARTAAGYPPPTTLHPLRTLSETNAINAD